MLVNLLLLVWLFFFIRSLYHKYREVSAYLWDEHTELAPKSPLKPLISESGLAVLVLVLVPALSGISWRQAAVFQPDLVYLLLVMLLISFFSGIFLAYIRFAQRQKLLYIKKATVNT